MGLFTSLAILLSYPLLTFAWEGYDYETGNYVEIESGNTVRSGNEIEVYDYETGDYEYYEVESIRRSGSSVELEVYDYETGEYRTFEMDD